MNRDQIKEIFLAHGFSIKEGQDDLKEYVYQAAEALVRLAVFESNPEGKKTILSVDPITDIALVAMRRIPELKVDPEHVADLDAKADLDPLGDFTQARGLPLEQESKYTIDGTHIINRESLKPIPHYEPVFVFRARDQLAAAVLQRYLTLILWYETKHGVNMENNDYSAHYKAVERRLEDFKRFAIEYPEHMKHPDTKDDYDVL